MMKKTYPAIFIPEESGFSVVFPEWLAVRGEKDGVNFSQLLTESLFEKYAHV